MSNRDARAIALRTVVLSSLALIGTACGGQSGFADATEGFDAGQTLPDGGTRLDYESPGKVKGGGTEFADHDSGVPGGDQGGDPGGDLGGDQAGTPGGMNGGALGGTNAG